MGRLGYLRMVHPLGFIGTSTLKKPFMERRIHALQGNRQNCMFIVSYFAASFIAMCLVAVAGCAGFVASWLFTWSYLRNYQQDNTKLPKYLFQMKIPGHGSGGQWAKRQMPMQV